MSASRDRDYDRRSAQRRPTQRPPSASLRDPGARPRAVPGRLPDAGRCIVAIYGALRDGVFTLEELNLDTAAAMTLMLAATGQTIVLLRGGIDLSIGGMISSAPCSPPRSFGDDPADGLWSGR